MSRMTRPSIVRMLRRARVARLNCLAWAWRWCLISAILPTRTYDWRTSRVGEAHQALACAMHQLGVRREGNRLLLHGSVDDHLPEVRGLGGSHASRDGQALLDQRDELILPHAR